MVKAADKPAGKKLQKLLLKQIEREFKELRAAAKARQHRSNRQLMAKLRKGLLSRAS